MIIKLIPSRASSTLTMAKMGLLDIDDLADLNDQIARFEVSRATFLSLMRPHRQLSGQLLVDYLGECGSD